MNNLFKLFAFCALFAGAAAFAACDNTPEDPGPGKQNNGQHNPYVSDPFEYEDLLGDYTGNGIPKNITKQLGPPRWEGRVFWPWDVDENGNQFEIENPDYIGITNFTEANTVKDEVPIWLDIEDGRLYLNRECMDGYLADGTVVELYTSAVYLDIVNVPGQIVQNGYTYYEEEGSYSKIEVIWNAADRTLTFPKRLNGHPVAFGILRVDIVMDQSGTNHRVVRGPWMDFQEGIVLTIDDQTRGGFRMSGGRKVDLSGSFQTVRDSGLGFVPDDKSGMHK